MREILQLFGHASGLHVKFAKSSATLPRRPRQGRTCCPAPGVPKCPIVDLPLTYLRILLMARRPTATQLQPLVDTVRGQLLLWKAGLTNKAGRLTTVKSILCAIPMHPLLVFTPPKKTIKQLEKTERGFLWLGTRLPMAATSMLIVTGLAVQLSWEALASLTWSAPG